MWLEARNLHSLVQQAVASLPDTAALEALLESKAIDNVLPRIKRVLQNKSRNAADRQKLAGPEIVFDEDRRVRLDDRIRAETIVLSDEFDLNELDALELVLTGEAQSESFDKVARGLCAVLCYYDTHRYYTSILAMLMDLCGQPSVRELSMPFVDTVAKDAVVFERLIEVLTTFTSENELQRLAKPTVNGVGNPKHKRMLVELMNEIQRNCFSSLYNLCAAVPNMSGFQYCSTLLDKIREISSTAMFDYGNLALMTTALSFVIYPRLLENVDPKPILQIYHASLNQRDWKDSTIAATMHLGYTVGLRSFAGRNNVDSDIILSADMIQSKVSTSIDLMALEFIRDYMMQVPGLDGHFAFAYVIDCTIRALISCFPEKMNELLRVCDGELNYIEDQGIHNVQQSFSFHFRTLLEIMTTLYSMDTPEMAEASDCYFSSDPSLHHFLAEVRHIENPTLLVSFLNMMNSMCRSETAADTLYYFFKQSSQAGNLSWRHLFLALKNYLNLFESDYPRVDVFNGHLRIPIMPQAELAGFLAWIKLAERLATLSSSCRSLFLDERGLLGSLIAIVASPVHSFLKGAILRLLAAFALDFENVSQTWHGLMHCGIVSIDAEGSLHGIPKDLEMKERLSGRYEGSKGYLKLLENLFWHAKAPVSSDLTPYVSFVCKSVLGGCFHRTYQRPSEMWTMLSSSFTVLYNICNNRTIDILSIREGQLHTVVLTQLLTSSGILDAIKHTLFEGSRYIDSYGSPLPEREEATLAALRLLHKALLSHTHLREAMRSADSTVKISTLDELFLSPSSISLSHGGNILNVNLLSLLCPYVSMVPEFLLHTNYVLDIIQKLNLLDSDKKCQVKYREALDSEAGRLAQVCSQLISVESTDVEWEFGQSSVSLDFNKMKPGELRGLACCTILEIISDGLETCPQAPSIASLLLGLDDLKNLHESAQSSCLKGVLTVIEHTLENAQPWTSQFVGLLERCLRVVDRLVSPRTIFSPSALTILRTQHDLIFKLMCFIDEVMNSESNIYHVDIPLIQGTILNLIAVEVSSLVMEGQHAQAGRIYHFLLNGTLTNGESLLSAYVIATDCPLWRSFSDIADRFRNDENLQFTLNDHLADNKKLSTLLQSCLISTTSALPQIDVEFVHNILIEDWSTYFPSEYSLEELHSVLAYCMQCNQVRSEQSANIHLLTGQLALINVVALFADIGLYDRRSVLYSLSNGVVSNLLSFANELELSEAVTDMITDCLFRIVQTISKLCLCFGEDLPDSQVHTECFSVLDALIKYLVNPGSFLSVRGKVDMYGSIFHMLHTMRALQAVAVNHSVCDVNPTLTLLEMHTMSSKNSPMQQLISQSGIHLAQCFNSDSCSSVFSLKLIAVSCVAEFLHDDCEGSRSIIDYLVRSGSIRFLLESVCTPNMMDSAKIEDIEKVSVYFKAVMALFARIAVTPIGWQSLVELGALTRLSRFSFWRHAPDELYLKPETVSQSHTLSSVYMGICSAVLRLSLAHQQFKDWEGIFAEVVSPLFAQKDAIQQLIRAKIKHSAVRLAVQIIASFPRKIRLSADDDSFVKNIIAYEKMEAKAKEEEEAMSY